MSTLLRQKQLSTGSNNNNSNNNNRDLLSKAVLFSVTENGEVTRLQRDLKAKNAVIALTKLVGKKGAEEALLIKSDVGQKPGGIGVATYEYMLANGGLIVLS